MKIAFPKHEMTIYDPNLMSVIIDFILIILMTALIYYLLSIGAERFYHTKRLPILAIIFIALQCVVVLKKKLDMSSTKALENLNKIKKLYEFRSVIGVLLLAGFIFIPYLGPVSGGELIWKTMVCSVILAAIMILSHVNDRYMKALICP